MEPAPASVLLHVLARHARRQHVSVALRAVTAGVMAMAFALLVLIGIDHAGAPLGLRWMTWVSAGFATIGVIAWQGRALVRRRQWVDIAGDLERRAAIGSGLLTAGTSFSQQPPRDASAWMINRTVVLAATAAADIRDWNRISPVAWRMPTAAAVLGAGLLVMALIPAVRPWLARAAYPGCGSGRPGDLQVTTIGGDRLVAAGSEPELAVEISAGIPAHVTATITWMDGRTERRVLAPVGDLSASASRWFVTLPPVTGPLTWQVEAHRQPGGPVRGESDRRRIDLAPGLSPTSFHLRVIPPAYANLPSQTISGDCAVVAGSQVELEATIHAAHADTGLSPTLVAANVVIASDAGAANTEIPATIDGTTLRATWVVRRSQRWGMRLIANGGRETLPDRQWRITVADDRAPKVQLGAVPATMSADAHLRVTVVADDDVALNETVLEVRRDHAAGALLTSITAPGNTPRRQQSVVVIDGMALGVSNGDTLAVVPVARDRAGQTTRGQPSLVTVTADGAGWDDLAARLERVTAATEVASTTLPALSDAWDRCGLDPLARTLLAGRLKSWGQALTEACEPWSPLPDVPADQAARQVVEDLAWWATHAISEVLVELNSPSESTPESTPTIMPGRLRLTAEDLHHLRLMIQRQREAVGHVQGRRAAVAEALAAHHHANSLLADATWLTPAPQGLIAQFSADEDHAPRHPGGIEVPAVDGRDVPGFGLNHVRIYWHGAIRVPRPNLELELTADDGIGLTVAGRERLPSEAWGDQPPTTWKSGPLAAGWQPLTIRWRQNEGGSLLRIAWAGSSAPIAADDLRAVDAPEWLMTTDATTISAHTAALEHHVRQLAQQVGPAAQALGVQREGAWTRESLTQALTLADQVAGQQPDTAQAISPGGPAALSLKLAELALDRARNEPLSPAGKQAVAVARRWLAQAVKSSPGVAAEDPTEAASQTDPEAEIRRIADTCAHLRKQSTSIPHDPQTPGPITTAGINSTAIIAGRDQVRTALAVACGTLALELRETLPTHAVLAEAFELLAARLRRTPDATEPPLMAGDASACAEIIRHLAELVSGPAREVAQVALAQAPGGPTDATARRLALAITHLSATCCRFDRVLQRPIIIPVQAPTQLASEPTLPKQDVTDAGISRARLSPPTLNDHGIDGFRPDQQSAIRAYLARMRLHKTGVP